MLSVLQKQGRTLKDFETVGPTSTHLDLALSILGGQADLGLGIRWAAEKMGLSFHPVIRESFRLALPLAAMSHPTMARLMDFLVAEIKTTPTPPGYDLHGAGQIQTMRD